MRLLQISKHYRPFHGGTVRIVEAIRRGLSKACLNTILVCTARGRGRTYETEGSRIIEAGSWGVLWSLPLSPAFPWLCAREIRRHRRVLLHLPFPGPDLVFLATAPRGTDLVVWWHSDIVRQRWLLPLYSPIVRATLRRARTILVSHPALIRASRFLPQFGGKCVAVPFGIEVDRYVLNPGEERAAERLRQEVAGNRAFALFVGRLVYYKGLDILLAALADTQVHLGIVGAGALEEQLKARSAALGLDGRITFFGEVPEERLRLLYAASHFLVLPSIAASETFGLVQLEAMAAGRPVINTALETAVPEISVNGVTGLTVPPGDPVALAEAMRRLSEDAGLRARLGENARRRVEREYSMSRMIEELAPILCGDAGRE